MQPFQYNWKGIFLKREKGAIILQNMHFDQKKSFLRLRDFSFENVQAALEKKGAGGSGI